MRLYILKVIRFPTTVYEKFGMYFERLIRRNKKEYAQNEKLAEEFSINSISPSFLV